MYYDGIEINGFMPRRGDFTVVSLSYHMNRPITRVGVVLRLLQSILATPTTTSKGFVLKRQKGALLKGRTLRDHVKKHGILRQNQFHWEEVLMGSKSISLVLAGFKPRTEF